MKYDELISSLRLCRQILHEDDKCIEFVDGCCEAFPVCAYQLMEKAADAIEALEIKAEVFKSAYIAEHNARIDEIKRNMWIPVTERLPQNGKFVLVCNDDGHMMIAKHETETYEWYYKYTNYDFDIWDNEEQGPVRHWMPLPEPPKEE